MLQPLCKQPLRYPALILGKTEGITTQINLTVIKYYRKAGHEIMNTCRNSTNTLSIRTPGDFTSAIMIFAIEYF